MNGKERLSISLDYDEDPSQPFPVLLYIPNVAEFDHHHIHLTNENAAILHQWLGDYLKTLEKKNV
jgi:hypothetical protein